MFTSSPTLIFCFIIVFISLLLPLPLNINRSAEYVPKRTFSLQPRHFQDWPCKGRLTPSQLHSVTSFDVQAFATLKAIAADSNAVVKAASLVPSGEEDFLKYACF